MRIAIRMDDITPDMDWEKFERFKALLDKSGIKPLIGVVPDNRDEKLKKNPKRDDFWQYITRLREDGWVIAMHGLNHLYTTSDGGLFPIGNKSEFADLPFQRQMEMVSEGKSILLANGIETDIFMAPSHSFDKNTIRALKENGFTGITDGFGKAPYKLLGMVFYPISAVRKKSLEDTGDGIVTFVYHANTMNDKDFEALEKLLLSGKAVSYSEFFGAEVQNRSFIGNAVQFLTASAKRMAVNIRRGRG
ncbi:MAG: DUF2334 domain-containing protein [Butyrivibrio sp.]|nr:DUF2334 domain-containing protein [Butyrivibrio sp.]